jgi:putative hydrolase
MEINNSHSFLSVEGIAITAKTQVSYVISSDAHVPGKVGHFDKALQNAIKANLDLSRIVNLEV